MFDSISRYFSEALEELNLVRWPTRQQAIRLSIIVLLFTLACAAVLGGVDYLLSELIKLILIIAT
jgi:preprotein translocase SecE subunit